LKPDPPTVHIAETLAELARIGRFVILRKLGAGGMGVVYAAYDEELERKLAIKVVLPGLHSERASLGETRLLREAQALARVSHPNVVQVYEVGSVGEAVYIAMELVRGHTLGEWLAAAPRRWREVLGVFQQVGAGLAAAHAAGVIHRDVKPDNILVGDDGRVRVVDFSLARPVEGHPSPQGDGPHDLARTRAGALVGTPLYMSPEQIDGQPADARSDQFSFCVTLYEALYRARPFAGTTLEELRESMLRADLHLSRTRGLLRALRSSDSLSRRSGASLARAAVPPAQDLASGNLAAPPNGASEPGPGEPSPAAGAPAGIRRALQRGLRVDPAARYPDMQALLTELGRDPSRASRRTALALGVVGLVAAGVATSVYVIEARAEVCRGAATELAGVWDPGRRDAAQRAVLATDVPFAATTWARVAVAMDTQAAAWVERRNAACADALHGARSIAMHGRRDACLDARLRELDALAQVLTEARPDTVERAVQAAANLRPLAPCDDEAALSARVPPPDEPTLAAAVEAVRRQLARVEALDRAGAFKSALAEAEAAHTAALALAYPPVHAEAGLARGRAALSLTWLTDAVTQLEDAYHLANRAGHDEVTMTAAIDLVVAHRELGHTDVAEGWIRFAEDALFRAGAPPGPTATLLQVHGRIAGDRGRPAEALAKAERALALLRDSRDAEHPDMVQAHNNLGLARRALGDDEGALFAYDQGLVLAEKILGVDHPGAVPLLNNRAVVLLDQGRVDEALVAYRHGLEIRARVYGTSHPRYAFSLAQIGDALTRQGKYTEAAEYFAQALAIRTRALGPDHPDVADTLIGIGKVEHIRGNKDAAVRATQRALIILTRALGPESPRVAAVKMNLAVLYRADGRPDAALALNAEVRALLEKTLPPNHERLMALRGNQANVLRDLRRHDEAIAEYRELLALQESAGSSAGKVAHILLNLGQTHVARGAPADAIPVIERALTVNASGTDEEFKRAQIELVLARALWNSRTDRPRARRIAQSTAATLRAAGPDAAPILLEVEKWLADPDAPDEP